MSVMKDTYLLAQLAFLAVTSGMETRQFVRITAHDFLWGYDDTLFSLARTYSSFTDELPYKKFGLLAQVVMVIVFICDRNDLHQCKIITITTIILLTY
jgi:hypothetical protein